ncbi:MAG TPA: hypothetical protein VN513_12405 [Gemmatimonadales bacterium]|nr:hypothetical protein [Gemmatimonadales bacterium]
MQLGEILDGSFNIYRRHFGLFMRLSLIIVWLPTALAVYLSVRFAGTPLAFLNVLEQHPLGSFGLGLVFLIIWVSSSLLLKAGTIRVISDSYLGQEPELGSALRFGVAKIVPLLLVALSKGLLIALIAVFGALGMGLVTVVGRLMGPAIGGLLVVVGVVGVCWLVIWVACGYGTTTPIVVLEELSSSFDAFGRSWELTRGTRGKVFGTMAVAWVIGYFLPQMVISGISSFLSAEGNPALQTFFVVLASLIGIVLAPILPCALTLLYYDLRVRREAFDLQILSEQLGPR